MGEASSRIFRLRPVTFRYKKPYANGEKPIQFGLIAEEVAQVFPELAVYDAQGEPQTVKYQLLGSLLLNEFLKEHQRVQEMEKAFVQQEQQVHAMSAQLKGVQDMKQTINRQQQQIESLTAAMEKMTHQMDAVAERRDGRIYQPVANHVARLPNE
jgi:methyl-accepting chemotaxis protein